MENVVLTIHLIVAVFLIGIVLLQRSEGGALGMGGGGGGLVSSRGAATALSKLTWVLAIAFILTSLTLTVLAARQGASRPILETVPVAAPAAPAAAVPDAGAQPGPGTGTVAPAAPVVPPAAPTVPPAAPTVPPAAD